MTTRERQEETESSPLPTKQENRQLRKGKKKKGSEQQSSVAALNYGAGASFIRIPSPRCSLSWGIKEEDTQSGFSLRPHWQCTQRAALTAAQRDSGGGGGRRGADGVSRGKESD